MTQGQVKKTKISRAKVLMAIGPLVVLIGVLLAHYDLMHSGVVTDLGFIILLYGMYRWSKKHP
jgi:uncharacterized membrane protein